MRERGQTTVEWVGLIAVVALLLIGLLAAGVRVPGADLARAIASRMLCAVAMADGCGDEPTLIATYGDEIGRLVRKHMPTILLEEGSHGLPVDFRRCRSTECGDGSKHGLVHLTDEGEHVTAFVHVIDCREGADHGTADCSGERAGNLYIQYWLYYANSTWLHGLPVADHLIGYHADDWESVQIRIGADGKVDERASSHHGYNYEKSPINWGSDLGDKVDIHIGSVHFAPPILTGPLRSIPEALHIRSHHGWDSETHKLLVSRGSHAGNTEESSIYKFVNGFDREVPGRRVHLVPLEPIVEAEGDSFDFGHITPPWRKHVWNDPESTDTS